MANSGPGWDGLLKWSLASSDGTQPSRNPSEEDRKWFMEAMQNQSVDAIKRMKEITLVMQTPENVLNSQGVTLEDMESILDELQEHVESIDMANDIKSIGGLVPLIAHLKHGHPPIRAKAADVLTTIVQNNPRGQEMVMEANGFESLFSNFMSDPDIVVRTQALGAISSLIRHNNQGICAFRLANGYLVLKDALQSENVRFQRKALNLLYYLLCENKSDFTIYTEVGLHHTICILALSLDGDIRETALRCILEFSKNKITENSWLSTEEKEELKQLVENRIENMCSMTGEDLETARENLLVDLLRRICCNESSILSQNGVIHP